MSTPSFKVIGFSGAAGSGKSTIAREYTREMGGYGYLMSFAAPLKGMLKAMLDYIDVDMASLPKEGESSALHGKSLRWAMQSLGTEWGRTCMGPTFWCHLAGRRIELVMKDRHSMASLVQKALPGRAGLVPVFVFDDVRFDTEVEFIHDLGGHVVHLVRGGAGTRHAHSSENGPTIPPDLIISNDGATPQEVAELVRRAL